MSKKPLVYMVTYYDNANLTSTTVEVDRLIVQEDVFASMEQSYDLVSEGEELDEEIVKILEECVLY